MIGRALHRSPTTPMRFALVLALSTASTAQSFFAGADHTAARKAKPDGPLEGLLAQAKAIAKDRGISTGETGIGLCAGAAAGIVCKKVQNTMMNVALLGAAGCAGACLLGIATPEKLLQQGKVLGEKVVDKAGKEAPRFASLLNKLDNDGDGKADIDEAKVTITKFAQRHQGLAGGFVGGALLGYRLA